MSQTISRKALETVRMVVFDEEDNLRTNMLYDINLYGRI